MFKDLIPWRREQTDLPRSRELTSRPSSDGARFKNEFDSMMDRVWNTSNVWDDMSLGTNGWGCEVEDSDKEIVVRAEAPGFQPEEIDVQLSGNRIVLKAEHREESKKTGSTLHSRFYRSMTVPQGIKADSIQAEYTNGVLEVHLPKGPDAQAKRIAVRAN